MTKAEIADVVEKVKAASLNDAGAIPDDVAAAIVGKAEKEHGSEWLQQELGQDKADLLAEKAQKENAPPSEKGGLEQGAIAAIAIVCILAVVGASGFAYKRWKDGSDVARENTLMNAYNDVEGYGGSQRLPSVYTRGSVVNPLST